MIRRTDAYEPVGCQNEPCLPGLRSVSRGGDHRAIYNLDVAAREPPAEVREENAPCSCEATCEAALEFLPPGSPFTFHKSYGSAVLCMLFLSALDLRTGRGSRTRWPLFATLHSRSMSRPADLSPSSSTSSCMEDCDLWWACEGDLAWDVPEGYGSNLGGSADNPCARLWGFPPFSRAGLALPPPGVLPALIGPRGLKGDL